MKGGPLARRVSGYVRGHGNRGGPSLGLPHASGARKAADNPLLWAAQILGLAVVYYLTAEFGLSLEVAFGNATPVWAPTGISLAALLIFGPHLWPGIAIGAFAANAATGIPLATSAVIAAGNTLEAIIGRYLLRRADFDIRLERGRDVIALVVLGAVVSTMVSATIGAASLFVSGEITAAQIDFTWQLWWLGDAMGNLLVAPAVLVWLSRPHRPAPGTRLEGVALALAALGVGTAVFVLSDWEYPFALLPLLVWAVLRFHHRGGTAVTLLFSIFALSAALEGSLPVGGITVRSAVSILQALMSTVSISMLMLAATIAERERAAADLRESEELGRAVFENSAVGIALADPLGRFASVNRVFSGMLGYSEDEIQRLSFADFIHEDDFDAHTVLFAELMKGHRDWFALEERHKRKDGSICWVRNTISLLRNDDGRPRFAIVLIEDISDRRRMEDARDQFIARASHELRTPLTSVVGFARLLSGDRVVDPSTREEIIEQIDGQAQRLTMMVGHLLDLTALQQGRLRMNPQPVDIAPLIKRLLAVAPAPEDKSVQVSVANGAGAFADPARLEQIVVNLLTNAYRYGGDTVHISAGVDGDRTFVRVEDNGAGIPEELVATLFEPFSRSEESAAMGGSGLGLSIVESLVEASGGEIGYESGPAGGATFTVWLPTQPVS